MPSHFIQQRLISFNHRYYHSIPFFVPSLKHSENKPNGSLENNGLKFVDQKKTQIDMSPDEQKVKAAANSKLALIFEKKT
jgi:hypothetical protein